MTEVRIPGLQEMVDFYLNSKNDWDGYRARSGGALWRASSLGMCQRRQYLEAIGRPHLLQPDQLSLRRFQVGHITAEALLRVFYDLGILVHPETPDGKELALYDPALRLGGHVDAILGGRVSAPPEHADDKYRAFLMAVRSQFTKAFGTELPFIGVEIKSVNSKTFWWAKKQNRAVASDGHLLQAAAYSLMAEKSGLHIDRWVVLSVSKDDNTIAESGITGSHKDQVLEIVGTLNDAYNRQQPPACNCVESGWQWAYCGFYGGSDESRRRRVGGERVKPDGECCQVTP